MKTPIISFICLFTSISTFSQIKLDSICNSVRYDTVFSNFIAEVNTAGKIYYFEDAILQQGLIFFDRGVDKKNLSKLYKTDTVLIKSWENALPLYKSRACLDMTSLSVFLSSINGEGLSKKERKKYHKNLFVDQYGIKYIKFSAKIIFIKIGNFEWKYRQVYADDCKNQDVQFCKKLFSSTFLIASVQDFYFRKFNSH
jgi:hypothetical protein